MEGTLVLLIPIIALVMGIGVGAWAIYWDHQKTRLQHEERRMMIEKGMTPPPDLAAQRKLVTPEDCLRRGTIMFFLGIGLGIASFVVLTLSDDADPLGRLLGVRGLQPAWLLGVAAAIVGLLGLGNLVYYFIGRNREAHDARD